MYLVVAEERGFDWKKLSGTVQNDIIKEYIAQKEWVYPPRQAMRIVRDSIVFSAQHLPRYNPVNVSGYHTREAGSTAIQEVAFTLARRDRLRRRGAQALASTSTSSRRVFRFISSRRSTSWRRSRSSGQRAVFGRGS